LVSAIIPIFYDFRGEYPFNPHFHEVMIMIYSYYPEGAILPPGCPAHIGPLSIGRVDDNGRAPRSLEPQLPAECFVPGERLVLLHPEAGTG
jgi:hypothetical protein